MMARCVEWVKRKREYLVVALGAVALFILYARNIPNICTIWEIPDEAGYLFNAALWTGQPWSEAFSNLNAYYGFGYSVLLIPVFLFCDTGRELIQGAIFVNVLVVVCTYLIQVKLMSELFNSIRREIWAFAAFAVSFYPYLICNAYKIDCETFLHFQLWLIALLLYYSIKYKRKSYCTLLAVAVPYIFFIHSRAIVIVAALLLTIAVYIIKSKQITKKDIVTVIIGIVVFAILYLLKNSIVDILGSGKIAQNATSSTKNLFTVSYFTDRFKWLFVNLRYYFIQAVGKGFYVITTTMGVAVWGLVCAVQHLKSGLKEYKSGDEFCREITILFLLLSFILMFVACAVNGGGTTYTYMFYGRYYEYVVNILLLLGLGMYFESKLTWSTTVAACLTTVIAGVVSLRLETYADSATISIDTARLAGFSYAITQSGNQYGTMILILITQTVLFLIICGIFKNYKYKNLVVCILLFVMFIPINNENVSKINGVNTGNESDMAMAEYIVDNIDEQEIYFVYEPYRYSSFYLRMQVFIKEYPLHVIYPEELDEVPEGSYVVMYIESDMAGELLESEESEFIMSSHTYELFVK